MAIFDRFSKRYDRKQDEKRRKETVVNPDDPPLPDEPIEQIEANDSPDRNAPCPCGSGKKYKKCCGKPT
jgi:uncharacterized protein YecA (UPF0149 family)